MGQGLFTRIISGALLFIVMQPVLANPHSLRAAVPKNVRLVLHPDQLGQVAASLQSPMPGVSVSSDFGKRRHPTLKKARFHGGVDYRAPMGTPVLAAGEGVVESIERSADHGLQITIRHDGQLVTGYSHLSAVASGLSVGQRISAQQSIGYVGRTGRASGPHLHFEVMVEGARIDPLLALAAPGAPQMVQVAFSRPLRLADALGVF